MDTLDEYKQKHGFELARLANQSTKTLATKAGFEGYFDTSIKCPADQMDFSSGKCEPPVMTKQQVLDSVIQHRFWSAEMDNIETMPELIMFSKQTGINFRNVDLNKLQIDELKQLVNAGGFTDSEQEFIREKELGRKMTQAENLETKWARVEQLGQILPEIQAKYKHDMASYEQTLAKLCAVIVGLIDEAKFRIGNETSPEHGTYGVSTLKPEHVIIDDKNKTLTFEYLGKRGEAQTQIIDDPTLFNAFMAVFEWQDQYPCEKKGSRRLFCWNDRGISTPVKDSDVREYLAPFGVKPHDFRSYFANTTLQNQINAGKVYEDIIIEIGKQLGHHRRAKMTAPECAKNDGSIIDGMCVFPTGKTAEKSYIMHELVDKYSKGRTAKNPQYYTAKTHIATITKRPDVYEWTRTQLLEYLKRNSKSKAWQDIQ